MSSTKTEHQTGPLGGFLTNEQADIDPLYQGIKWAADNNAAETVITIKALQVYVQKTQLNGWR